MADVRCADCGFLCARRSVGAELTEVDLSCRQEWNARDIVAGGGSRTPLIFLASPACFAMKRRFDLEDRDKGKGGITEAIQKPIECSSFVPWQQGFSPKEHREMMTAQQMQVFQEEQRRRDRDWQEEQKTMDRAWQVLENRKNRITQVFCMIVAVLCGLAGVIIGKKLSEPAPIVIQVPVPAQPEPPAK
jgi:hypothetical protein